MSATFGQVWRRVRLHAPNAPALLVQDWVQNTYAQATDSRPWGWTLQPLQLIWGDVHDISACVTTRGSATVTSVGLFVTGDVGRQFRVGGSGPLYTIIARPDVNTITLDQVYEGPDTGTVEAEILDAYVSMPADFGAFTALVDVVNQRWIPWWCSQEELDLLDPRRNSASNRPRLLASLALAQSNTPDDGLARYEYWPTPTEAGAFQGFYRIRPTALTDDTQFRGVLATRPDVLETGALAQCARWPGTVGAPNPYFNIQLSRDLDMRFHDLLNQLDLRDDDMYPQSLDKVPWQRWSAWTWAYDTHLLQQTDATLSAYWGMGLYPSF